MAEVVLDFITSLLHPFLSSRSDDDTCENPNHFNDELRKSIVVVVVVVGLTVCLPAWLCLQRTTPGQRPH